MKAEGYARIYFLPSDRLGNVDGASVIYPGTLEGLVYGHDFLTEDIEIMHFNSNQNATGSGFSRRLPPMNAGERYMLDINYREEGLVPFLNIHFYNKQREELETQIIRDDDKITFEVPEHTHTYRVSVHAKGAGSFQFFSFEIVNLSLRKRVANATQPNSYKRLSKNINYHILKSNKSEDLLVTFGEISESFLNDYWTDAFSDVEMNQLHLTNINLLNSMYLNERDKLVVLELLVKTIARYSSKNIYLVGTGMSSAAALFYTDALMANFNAKVFISNPIIDFEEFKLEMTKNILARSSEYKISPEEIKLDAIQGYVYYSDETIYLNQMGELIKHGLNKVRYIPFNKDGMIINYNLFELKERIQKEARQ
jgi:hypothetical protein